MLRCNEPKHAEQCEFIAWWDQAVGVRLHADNKVNADLRSPLSKADAETQTGISQQMSDYLTIRLSSLAGAD